MSNQFAEVKPSMLHRSLGFPARQIKLLPVPKMQKNGSATSDFQRISEVLLQIFCIFLARFKMICYLCGIKTKKDDA